MREPARRPHGQIDPELAHDRCIAGALTRVEFAVALHNAGLDDVEITETHLVHEHAGSAIIRARKPE